MARVFPQAPISSPYMSTEREIFTVWMKSLIYQTNGLTVYNSNGEITYRVENYDKSSNEVHVMDLHGNILFTIRKKKCWVFGSWYVYRECGSFSSNEEVKPFFRIKRSSIRDGDWEVRDETNEVFWIIRFDPKFAFQLLDIHGNIIAKVKPKQSSNGVNLGEDVLTLELSFQMWTNQMQDSLNFKKKGDVAFRHKEFASAIDCYSQFIEGGTMVSPTVYARRSLCYLMNEMPQEALNDAMQAQVISPAWHIASYLQAVALSALGQENEAHAALKDGSMLESKRNTL